MAKRVPGAEGSLSKKGRPVGVTLEYQTGRRAASFTDTSEAPYSSRLGGKNRLVAGQGRNRATVC